MIQARCYRLRGRHVLEALPGHWQTPTPKFWLEKAVQCRLFRLMGLMFFKTSVTTTLEKSMKRGPQVSVAHLRRSAGTSNFWSWPLLVAMCRCQHHRRSMASRVRVVQKLGGYNKMVTLKGKGVRWCKQSWDFGVPYFETHVICRSTIGSVHFHCPQILSPWQIFHDSEPWSESSLFQCQRYQEMSVDNPRSADARWSKGVVSMVHPFWTALMKGLRLGSCWW